MHRPAPIGYPASRRPPTEGRIVSRTQTARAISRWPTCLLGPTSSVHFIYGYKNRAAGLRKSGVAPEWRRNGITFVATPITKLYVVRGDDAYESPGPSLGFSDAVRGHKPGPAGAFRPRRTAQNAIDYDQHRPVGHEYYLYDQRWRDYHQHDGDDQCVCRGAVIPAGEDFTVVDYQSD